MTGKQGRIPLKLVFYWLAFGAVVFFFSGLAFTAARPCYYSVHEKAKGIKRLLGRGEVNPVSDKFKTRPDPGMPGEPDLDILSKVALSTYDDEAMSIMSEMFLPGVYQAFIAMANGYVGITGGSVGPGYEKAINQTNYPTTKGSEVTEGWPLKEPRQTFASISGFFTCQKNATGLNYPELLDLGCESVIAGIPHPLGLLVQVGDQVLNSTVDDSTIHNFTQAVNMYNGTFTWAETWTPKNTHVKLDIQYTVIVHRNRPNVAVVRLRVTPHGGNLNATIIDVIDGRSAVRSSLGAKGLYKNTTSMYVSNHPDGMPHVEAFVVSTVNVSNGHTNETSRRETHHQGGDSDMSIGQAWDVQLTDGKTAIFEKYVGLASTDKFSSPEITAFNESLKAHNDGWEHLFSEHTKAWNILMDRNLMTNLRNPNTGSLPPNETIIEKLQAMAVANRYYIMQNLLPENGTNLNDDGISVGGHSSPAYAGMKFWDMDLWIFPAIAASSPHYAKQMIKFRLKQWRMAKANAQASYVQEKYKFDNDSALYSWTSGRWGNATATGPVMDYEYHLNADIVFTFFQYLAITRDQKFFKEELLPVAESICHTITTLLVKEGDGYSIKNMTDPDEYANNINNGAFTLAAFSQVLRQTANYQRNNNIPVNETWVHISENVNIPVSETGITLEYEGMPNNVTIKQADVVLRSYPLDDQTYSLKQSSNDMGYYFQKQTPDGPAMTAAILAIVENRVASSGCAAFQMELAALMSNARLPFLMFSEQANDDPNANGGVPPAFPFLTGHGGAAQIHLFGYLGLNLARDELTIRPALPHPFKNMQIQDFYFNGNRIRAIMTPTHTNLTRLPPGQGVTGLFDIYPGTAMPVIVERRNTTEGVIKEVHHTLMMNESIIIENDIYWQQTTTTGNILQCQTIISRDDYASGQYPGAATDGNVGTRWQPLTRDPATITVNTSTVEPQRVFSISFEWGGRTPETARVGLTNRSDAVFGDEDLYIVPMPFQIQPSAIYGTNSTSEIKVMPYHGNRTDWVIPAHLEIWTGNYTILEIAGCNACGWIGEVMSPNGSVVLGDEDGQGATVGEFEIIGWKGTGIMKGMHAENDDKTQGAGEEPLGFGGRSLKTEKSGRQKKHEFAGIIRQNASERR